jgi:hypothetical protein
VITRQKLHDLPKPKPKPKIAGVALSPMVLPTQYRPLPTRLQVALIGDITSAHRHKSTFAMLRKIFVQATAFTASNIS